MDFMRNVQYERFSEKETAVLMISGCVLPRSNPYLHLHPHTPTLIFLAILGFLAKHTHIAQEDTRGHKPFGTNCTLILVSILLVFEGYRQPACIGGWSFLQLLEFLKLPPLLVHSLIETLVLVLDNESNFFCIIFSDGLLIYYGKTFDKFANVHGKCLSLFFRVLTDIGQQKS